MSCATRRARNCSRHSARCRPVCAPQSFSGTSKDSASKKPPTRCAATPARSRARLRVDWTRLRELVSDPTTPVQPDAPDISAAVFGLARPGVGKHPDIAATLLVDAEASSELGNWQSFGDRSVPVKSVRGRIGQHRPHRTAGNRLRRWRLDHSGATADAAISHVTTDTPGCASRQVPI